MKRHWFLLVVVIIGFGLAAYYYVPFVAGLENFWFGLLSALFGSFVVTTSITLAFIRLFSPWDKYKRNPACKRHSQYICTLCALIIGLLGGVTGATTYLVRGNWEKVSSIVREDPGPGPTAVELKPLSRFVQTRWVYDHGKALLAEGTKDVVVVEVKISNYLKQFDWILTTPPGFGVVMRAAYKIERKNSGILLEPLSLTQSANDRLELRLDAGNKGDQLLAIVGIISQGQKIAEDLTKARIIQSEFRRANNYEKR